MNELTGSVSPLPYCAIKAVLVNELEWAPKNSPRKKEKKGGLLPS